MPNHFHGFVEIKLDNDIVETRRAVADMEKSEQISPTHLSEAIQYRSLDRSGCMV